MKTAAFFILLLFIFQCKTLSPAKPTPCANLSQKLKEKFANTKVKVTPNNGANCKAIIYYKKSSLEYSEDKKGLLYKNLALYQQVFEQSEMDVKKERLSFSSANQNNMRKLETIKLTIIPRKNKGRVKTINYFQKYRSVSYGASAESEVYELANWLLTR